MKLVIEDGNIRTAVSGGLCISHSWRNLHASVRMIAYLDRCSVQIVGDSPCQVLDSMVWERARHRDSDDD